MSRTRLLCAAGRTSVPAGPYCDAVRPSRWGHTHPAICFPTCHPTTTAARPCPLWPPPGWTGTAPRTGCPASCGPVAVSCTPSAEADVLRRHGFRRTCHAMTIVAWANPAQHGQPRQEPSQPSMCSTRLGHGCGSVRRAGKLDEGHARWPPVSVDDYPHPARHHDASC